MPGTTDTVKAKLTPGEFVIRKEAVDMIGVPMLNQLNNMPEEGGHSAIDALIQKATLSNMKMMYGGGMVNPNYAGGGMVDEYGHGGKVKKNLKPLPEGNPGLGQLPEMVRNRMGYMQMGGMVDDSLMGMMGGGMAMKKNMQGYQDGGKVSLKDYAGLVGDMVTSFGGTIPEGMYTSEGGLTREGIAKMYDLNPESMNIDTLSFANPANYMFEVTGKKQGSGADVTGTTRRTGSLPIEGLLNTAMKENIESPLERMRFKVDLNKIKDSISYQEGGPVGDPLGIDMRQANPEMLSGQSIGAVMDQAMMLQDSIKQDTVNKARKSLMLMRIENLLKDPALQEEMGFAPEAISSDMPTGPIQVLLNPMGVPYSEQMIFPLSRGQ